MARFGAPHGVRGWLRLHLFSRQPDFFIQCRSWWCQLPAPAPTPAQEDANWQEMTVEQCRLDSGQWRVKLAEVDTREAAASWCNGWAAVPYDTLPPPPSDSFYWCDLIGLRVENLQGEYLGDIAEMMDIGAHDVLCVRAPDKTELLIPFVSRHVGSIEGEEQAEVEKRVLRVDWQHDW